MFHGKHSGDGLDRAARRVGIDLTPLQRTQLGRFGEWLATEAVDAGGIGPAEEVRLIDRHLADSIIFASAWSEKPSTILDVGSGVGLPGIPLAILYPDAGVTLLDRSRERCRLARRAVRVVGLKNVSVDQRDALRASGTWDVVTFRASLKPVDALKSALPLLSDRGCAVIGLSRSAGPGETPLAPTGAVVDLLEVDEGVLDSPAWLLRMKRANPRDPDRDAS